MNNIKTISRRTFRYTSAVIAVGGLLFSMTHAGAWPTTSPSARQAARLKYRPPVNWIRHYLGDDRYKIAGGTWKVVSTQNDSQYHRADCPQMLRQSPDIVIGFPSPAHGREAGYGPDALCDPDNTSANPYDITATKTIADVARGPLTGRRITLKDGVSSILLPKGWKYTFNKSGLIGQSRTWLETLTSPSGGRIRVSTIHARGVDVDFRLILTPQTLRSSGSLLKNVMAKYHVTDQSGIASGAIDRALKAQKVDSYSVGGLRGVRVIDTSGGDGQRQEITVGTRFKMYAISDTGVRPEVADSVISTFIPR